MMRRIATLALIGVIMTAGGLYWLTSATTELTLEGLADIAAPQLLQRIRNFRRVVARDGQKVLEVSAREAAYYKGQKALAIVEPKVAFYEGGEEVASLRGSEGRLYLEGNDVTRAEVSGEIVLRAGMYRLLGEDASYDRKAQKIVIAGAMKIESPDLQLSGTGLTLDVLEGRLVVESGVRMHLEPVRPAPPTKTPSGEALEGAPGEAAGSVSDETPEEAPRKALNAAVKVLDSSETRGIIRRGGLPVLTGKDPAATTPKEDRKDSDE